MKNLFLGIYIFKTGNYLRFLIFFQEKPIILMKHAHSCTSVNTSTASLYHSPLLPCRTKRSKRRHLNKNERRTAQLQLLVKAGFITMCLFGIARVTAQVTAQKASITTWNDARTVCWHKSWTQCAAKVWQHSEDDFWRRANEKEAVIVRNSRKKRLFFKQNANRTS